MKLVKLLIAHGHGRMFRSRAAQRGPHGRAQAHLQYFKQLARGFSDRLYEVGRRVAVEENDTVVAVHDH